MKPAPVIKAVFELDEKGQPAFVEGTDHRHYRIRLHVENVPEDTYAVTYLLHETYYNPVRESRDRTVGFTEDLTSYGDYTVQAKIRSREGIIAVATQLSAALAAGHAGYVSPEIESALKEIRAH
ncbi:MAG: hypothetical protein LAO23_11710 [Acidobacteriia bacterium]|nr:hypothetical protein [Terriglobia bacterium]